MVHAIPRKHRIHVHVCKLYNVINVGFLTVYDLSQD